jgi:hypothetical protein
MSDTSSEKLEKDSPPRRIELGDDTLILDEDFCHEVLGGATRRTSGRLDAEGLPFVMVAGRKYRPLRRGRAWLSDRIISKQPRTARRAAERRRGRMQSSA